MKVSLSNLSVGYRRRVVASNLNLSIAAGELVALTGCNGAGKSTLLRTVARLQPALSGEIELAGKPLGEYPRSALAGLLSIVSTETVNVAHLTVRQLVSLGRFPHTNWLGKLTTKDVELVEEAMQLTGITSLAHKNLHEISDGERQRAMIARTLAQDTDIILLDEPTAYLDMPNKYEIMNLLQRLTRTKQKTILISTHDLQIAMQEADKLWLMIDGFIVDGAPEDLALKQQLSRMFEGTNLHFDDLRGHFNAKRHDLKNISAFGEEKLFFWTKKALERLGYAVSLEENENRADIVIKTEAGLTVWILKNYKGSPKFASIYDLAKYLTSTIFFEKK